MIRDRQDGDADVQYLVGIPAGWAIVPANGKITAISSRIEPLLAEKRPIPDLVMTTMFAESAPDAEVRFTEEEGLWSPAIIDSLREKKMEQARLGVGALGDIFRNTEGCVTYTTFDQVRKEFPHRNSSGPPTCCGGRSWVNSSEEIAVLEKATETSETGLQAMIETARPAAVPEH